MRSSLVFVASVFFCSILGAAPPSVDVSVILGMPDPAVNGRLLALEKRVGIIESKVNQSNKKLDRVLAAIGPITKWVQAQDAKDAKEKTQTKEQAYVWVASQYGEYAFIHGANNAVLAYVNNEWRQCYLPYGNGVLCVISGNVYCGVGHAAKVYEALR